jgi:hypothetical protein
MNHSLINFTTAIHPIVSKSSGDERKAQLGWGSPGPCDLSLGKSEPSFSSGQLVDFPQKERLYSVESVLVIDGPQRSVRCPFHDDLHLSFSIYFYPGHGVCSISGSDIRHD